MKIFCSDGQTDFEGTVADDADLDGTFTLICDEDGKAYRINGWLMTDCEVLEDGIDTGVEAMAERISASMRGEG